MVDNGFIVKFSDNTHIKDVAKGNIFCENIKYFRNLEDNERPGVKDQDEISSVLSLTPDNSKFFISDSHSNPHIIESKKFIGKLSLKYTPSNNIAISSFVFLDTYKDFKNIGNNIYKLKDNTISELCNQFKNRPCSIIPLENFYKLIKKNLISSKENYHFKQFDFKRVNYYKAHNETSFKSTKSEEDVLNSAFYKSEYFKEQREFRLAIMTDSIDNLYLKNKSNFQFPHIELSSPTLLKNFYFNKY